MQLKPGTLLHGGTYKIEKMLGQGSFGITYLAEHTSLGKKVAIKEFFMKELNSRGDDGSITGMSDGSLSHNYAQKFKKEAINLSRLEHPNIVRVTDSFDENGTYYYVMDYIDGMNLNDYIKKYSPSEVTAIKIIKDVAKALEYMHEEKHMLHLDLKPGNIMRRNSDGHIFLIDFGLSKHYDGNGAPETSTTIGLGTAGYAPIEQANQAKNGEFRPTIDVYALGATLYKLLTGETPPVASELVSDDDLLKESLWKHGVSDSLSLAVINAMMPSVKKRTQSIRAFIESLPSDNTSSSASTVTEPVESEETEFITTTSNQNNQTTQTTNKCEAPIGDLNESNATNKVKGNGSQSWKYITFVALVVLAILLLVLIGRNGSDDNNTPNNATTPYDDSKRTTSIAPTEDTNNRVPTKPASIETPKEYVHSFTYPHTITINRSVKTSDQKWTMHSIILYENKTIVRCSVQSFDDATTAYNDGKEFIQTDAGKKLYIQDSNLPWGMNYNFVIGPWETFYFEEVYPPVPNTARYINYNGGDIFNYREIKLQ